MPDGTVQPISMPAPEVAALTVADLADLQFEPMTGVKDAIPRSLEWLSTAGEDRQAMLLGAAILEMPKSDIVRFATDTKPMCEDLLQRVHATKGRFEGFAEAMGCMEARLISAMACAALAGGDVA